MQYPGSSFPCELCKASGQKQSVGGVYHELQTSPSVIEMAHSLADALKDVFGKQGRMLGVMQAAGETLVTVSATGVFAGKDYQDFVMTVWDEERHISPIAHDWCTLPSQSLGGHDLSTLVKNKSGHNGLPNGGRLGRPQAKAGSQRANWSTSGCSCAAPKLISYLTQPAGTPYAGAQLRNIFMVEVCCGKDTKSRRHNEMQESCSNCKKILPTLLCRKGCY